MSRMGLLTSASLRILSISLAMASDGGFHDCTTATVTSRVLFESDSTELHRAEGAGNQADSNSAIRETAMSEGRCDRVSLLLLP